MLFISCLGEQWLQTLCCRVMKQECGVMYLKKEMGCALLLHVSVTNQCLPFLNVNRVLASHLKEVCTWRTVFTKLLYFFFLRYALADKVWPASCCCGSVSKVNVLILFTGLCIFHWILLLTLTRCTSLAHRKTSVEHHVTDKNFFLFTRGGWGCLSDRWCVKLFWRHCITVIFP